MKAFVKRWLAGAAVSAFGMGAVAAAEPPELASLVKAAQAEGRVVVAGPPVQAHRDAVMRFEAAYPGIKVEFSGMPPQAYEPRISTERAAGKYVWDILITGVSSTTFARQIPAGWFDPLEPVVVDPRARDNAQWAGGFAAGFMDKEQRYVYAFAADLAGGMFVNRDAVGAGFGYEQLLDEKWRGRIAILDPRARGPGSTTFRQLVAVLGEDKACQLLKNQQLVLSESPKQVVDWIVRGTYPIAIGVDSATLNGYQAQGIGKNVVLVQDPRGTILSKWGNIMLMNRAPNPNAARLFVNWMLTTQAQAVWAETGKVNSRRTDVKPGNESAVVPAKVWASAYNLSSEKTAAEGVRALQLAKDCLK
ncbi:MAG: extracellular solute-binding protein [Burkholderiales bacterium]|nr:extracellular solute-binding protein [Burkholderiales bacterium]